MDIIENNELGLYLHSKEITFCSLFLFLDNNNKQLLPGLLVDSADYHPEKELFPEGNARGK